MVGATTAPWRSRLRTPVAQLFMFSLRGEKTLVVGMKKSGMASAELLAREGAVVRATDLKPLDRLPGAGALLERLEDSLRAADARGVRRVRLDRALARCSRGSRAARRGPAAGRARGGRGGAGRAVSERAHHRDHRFERQNHHHQPDRPHPARSRRVGPGGRQYRNARHRHGGRLARRWLERAGALQLPTGDHRTNSARTSPWR